MRHRHWRHPARRPHLYPTVARFLSVDPRQGGCANPYAYSFGNPLTGADLDGQGCGLSFWDWLGIGLGAVAILTGVGALVLAGAAAGTAHIFASTSALT